MLRINHEKRDFRLQRFKIIYYTSLDRYSANLYITLFMTHRWYDNDATKQEASLFFSIVLTIKSALSFISQMWRRHF